MEPMNCMGCIFAQHEYIYRQTGCAIRNRQPEIKEDYAEDGEVLYWQLEGLCQYKRQSNWKYYDYTLEQQKVIVKDEVKLDFDVSFLANNDARTREQFSYIRALDYQPVASRALFSDPTLYKKSLEENDDVRETEHRVLVMDNESDWRILQGRTSGGHYFACFDDVTILPENFFSWLNTQINDNELRFYVATGVENCIISTLYFKKVQLSINDLKTNAERLGKSIELPELIKMCKENKNWDKELGWTE